MELALGQQLKGSKQFFGQFCGTELAKRVHTFAYLLEIGNHLTLLSVLPLLICIIIYLLLIPVSYYVH